MNEREIIIPYADGDCGVNQFVFKQRVIYDVIKFVLESFYKIEEATDCLKKDVIVCLPRYIIEELNRQLVNELSFDSGVFYLCGIKCQISYENSVTVFFNHYIPNKIIKYTKEL